MRTVSRSVLLLLACLGWCTRAPGQLLPPFELRQTNLAFNVQSQRGMPILPIDGNPTASDGRAPSPPGELTTSIPSAHIFQNWLGFGAVASPRTPENLVPDAPYAARAVNIGLPVAKDAGGAVRAVVSSARVGATFYGRPVAFLFGSRIPVPETDEADQLLSARVPPIRPEDYWFPEPYSTNRSSLGYHTNETYYWSPHARAVFAIQSGPIKVRWRKIQPSQTQPPDYSPARYVIEAGFYYRIFSADYVVSGSAIKQPQKIFWTEKVYRATGKPVTVPKSRVGDVHIVYTPAFKDRVEHEIESPGQVPPVDDPSQRYEETRTLWYDAPQGQIFAHNLEGRVFVELLGDITEGSNRQHLGFEIVDVLSQPSPDDVSAELGDRVPAFADGTPDEDLKPEPVLVPGGDTFTYQHSLGGSGRSQYYAIRETLNANDVFFHWLREGDEGLYWPFRYVRYAFKWPTKPERFSHYARPAVANALEAESTAVPLPLGTFAAIDFQDPLDRPRAGITSDSRFYSELDAAHPAHRALLRFVSGNEVAFERVFSWLDEALGTPALFVGSVATNLTAWNSTTTSFNWTDPLRAPRVVSGTVEVGSRVLPPSDETIPDPNADYWSGHIRTESGTSYNPGAYFDPFEHGFEVANLGAIIPVNAIPGTNSLVVWWFRRNAADLTKGFPPSYWPSVIGRYTLAWPTGASEIVLASNDGSGALESIQARGSIYTQNDPAQHGYNPNEEHAVMIGGTAYALRDDLNITSGSGFSSQPYVLLQYTGEDGRPAMRPFRVRRERPETGDVFDFLVSAGTRLQAPMPLPLLEKPLVSKITNYRNRKTGWFSLRTLLVSANEEPSGGDGDLPGGWVGDGSDETGPFGFYKSFTFRDRKNDFWVYRALHAGLPQLQVGTADPAGPVSPPAPATAVVGQRFDYELHSSRLSASLTVQAPLDVPLPAWLRIDGTALRGTPQAGDVGAISVPLVVTAIDDGATASVSVPITVETTGVVVGQVPLEVVSTNPFTASVTTFVGRPPYLATSPTPTNSFRMRFYYKTLSGFAWPGFTAPPVGTVVPYLRPSDGAGGFAGNPTTHATAALDIVYRPYWPYSQDRLSQFRIGDTLTNPKAGLPAIRGQSSVRLLYEQSIATNIQQAVASVVLHDPTREKTSDLLSAGLKALPPGVRGESIRGKTQFPNLPPHLAGRLFYDPNRGTNGALVLTGVYKDNGVGDPYLLLNVLRGSDLAAAKGLCPAGEGKTEWDAAIDALATTVTTELPSEQVPGTYAREPQLDTVVGVQQLAEITSEFSPVDSYALSASGPGTGYITVLVGNGGPSTPASEPVDMKVIRVAPPQYVGEVKIIPAENPLSEFVTFQHSVDVGGRFNEYEYDWRIGAPVDGKPPEVTASMVGWTPLAPPTVDMPRYTLGGAGIQVLGDNYIVLRYRPKSVTHPLYNQWSAFTTPQLAEGWIKRVLAGINPFNQRITDLYNNRANTDVSLLTQAGPRWEGDVALTLEALNGYGLIEIYETVLRRGKSLSIEAGINYGPANDALLLAAGYLNDLYNILGGEAWADAANPTIGIGTKDRTYGDIATALFAFKGQTSSLLEEELALLRGRDDFLQPGVLTRPVYNRLFWNYTRGIDSGEVIYALNYNILEDADGEVDGVVNAEDARKMFPQGHGDAYGHYLTALKGYYRLLLDTDFDWVPRSEAVTVLGKPIQVDYQDERKFAASAAAVARTGRQVFDLTWRRDYQSGDAGGWRHLEETRTNTQRSPATTRHWGLDHWANRTAAGAYFNWVVGNAILPDVDRDPTHEGITRIDRTTVPELKELASTAEDLQTSLDNAAARVSPLGIPEDSIAFDIQPQQVTGAGSKTHFEQIYDRASGALQNAVAAFDDAKDVTRLLRSEQDSLVEFQAGVDEQERAFSRRLIELYGSPYPDDIGPGKTWKQGYEGPDLVHYMWVDLPELVFPELWNHTESVDMQIDLSDLPAGWQSLTNSSSQPFNVDWTSSVYENIGLIAPSTDSTGYTNYLRYELGPHGFSDKPSWVTGRRASPGELQQSISEIILSHRRLKQALYDSYGGKSTFDRSLKLFQEKADMLRANMRLANDVVDLEKAIDDLESTYDITSKDLGTTIAVADLIKDVALQGMPEESIFGIAFGGDLLFPVRAIIAGVYSVGKLALLASDAISHRVFQGDVKEKRESIQSKTKAIANNELRLEIVDGINDLFRELEKVQTALETISVRLREFDDAQRAYRSLAAKGLRLQDEREVFRRRAAAVTQGFRTRDAAFRIFRTEKLERYKTLFDLASRYTLLAANAYDYETGLLNTPEGRTFVNRIIQSRALGVVRDGAPQFAGSNTGDPGLSSVLAEMRGDWEVLRGRLGFNNPDGYGTTLSLRSENYRILPGAEGADAWRDVLERGRLANLLDDQDVQRYCMQISRGDGLPVPGIILEFATTIADGLNLFGRPMGPGDHSYSASAFATKIFAAGVALEGYKGMSDPSATAGSVGFAGGVTPSEPTVTFLDPSALSATPYVYLLPVGADSMRSPPLGDASSIRTWNVHDVTVPLPFNVGASTLATGNAWQSTDFLTEPLFGFRKHQAFRPVSNASVFSPQIYELGGGLATSQFTNRRLIGRSVWNSRWKLVIPGHALLADPKEGLDRLLRSLRDVKLHFITYSYSGN